MRRAPPEKKPSSLPRVLRNAWPVVAKAFNAFQANPTQRLGWIIVVFVGEDPLSHAVYQEIASTPGSTLPPAIPYHELSAVGIPYAAFMEVAEHYFDLSTHVDPPLEPNMARLAILVDGTIHIQRIDSHAVPLPRGLVRSPGGSA
jgi:hypothetical protein